MYNIIKTAACISQEGGRLGVYEHHCPASGQSCECFTSWLDFSFKEQMNETDQLNIVRNLFFTGEDLLLDSWGWERCGPVLTIRARDFHQGGWTKVRLNLRGFCKFVYLVHVPVIFFRFSG